MNTTEIQLDDAKALAIKFSTLYANLSDTSGATALCKMVQDISTDAWAGKARTAFDAKCAEIEEKLKSVALEVAAQRVALLESVDIYATADSEAASVATGLGFSDQTNTSADSLWNNV